MQFLRGGKVRMFCGVVCTYLLLVVAATINAQVNNPETTNTVLRVLIYPYIPDLNGDMLMSLRNYIKTEFEAQNTGITLVVDGDSMTDLYSLEKMEQYLGTGSNAYDVVELDTILLGEVVAKGLLEPIHDPLVKESFLPFTERAVTYGGEIYGVPTLVGANFLAKITSEAGSGTLDLVGNFRGSWTLPGYYLSAFVNANGRESSIYEGVNSDPHDHVEEVNRIKMLSDRCLQSDQSTNPCTNGYYKANPNKMTEAVIRLKESHFLAYSEVIGEVLYKAPSVKVRSVEIPPLGGKEQYLQMYTDAVVANRNTYEAKKNAIKRFMDFYTSDDFRLRYAFCGDMVEEGDTSCTRYVLPANVNFYKNSRVAENYIYKQIYAIIQARGIGAPNRELYHKRRSLDTTLSNMLKYDANSKQEL